MVSKITLVRRVRNQKSLSVLNGLSETVGDITNLCQRLKDQDILNVLVSLAAVYNCVCVLEVWES